VFGKTITQIIRLSGVLQALETCFDILLNLKSKNRLVINVEVEKELDEIISKLPPYNMISLTTFRNARYLMAYYNINRILMAGYKLNLLTSINENNLDNFLDSSNKTHLTIPYSNDLKAIMESDGSIISATFYAQNKRLKAKFVLELFQYLEDYKLGRIISKKNKSGPISYNFEKIKFELIETNGELIYIIEVLNIDFLVFKSSYNKSNGSSRNTTGKILKNIIIYQNKYLCNRFNI